MLKTISKDQNKFRIIYKTKEELDAEIYNKKYCTIKIFLTMINPKNIPKPHTFPTQIVLHACIKIPFLVKIISIFKKEVPRLFDFIVD